MIEKWKPVPGYGDNYEASTLGRVRSKARMVRKRHKNGRVMVQHYPERVIGSRPDVNGYCHVHISVDGIKSNPAVHRLVALAFHGHPADGQECCHNNGNPSDNRPDNLRWDTHLENNRDRLRHGNYARGQDHHQAKFPDELLDAIRGGKLTRKEALGAGVSHSHFYRLRNAV